MDTSGLSMAEILKPLHAATVEQNSGVSMGLSMEEAMRLLRAAEQRLAAAEQRLNAIERDKRAKRTWVCTHVSAFLPSRRDSDLAC